MIFVLVRLINTLITLYSFIIIARAFLSLAGTDMYNPIIRFIYQITEPILAPLRRYTVFGMLDFSPLAALILLSLVQFIINNLAAGLR